MTTAASAPTTDAWADAFSRATDEDPEIQAHGKYFTCSYLLDMTDHRFVVTVSRGKVVDVAIDPGPLDVPYEFAIRASADTCATSVLRRPNRCTTGYGRPVSSET